MAAVLVETAQEKLALQSEKELAAKDEELRRVREEHAEQGRGLEASGKRRRVAAEAACALQGRLVEVKLEKREADYSQVDKLGSAEKNEAEEDLEESRETLHEKNEAEEDLEESRETLGYQIRTVHALQTK
ncbi:hypothetical protein T484DRAFT_1821015, partial [Baffinella frigidus]